MFAWKKQFKLPENMARILAHKENESHRMYKTCHKWLSKQNDDHSRRLSSFIFLLHFRYTPLTRACTLFNIYTNVSAHALLLTSYHTGGKNIDLWMFFFIVSVLFIDTNKETQHITIDLLFTTTIGKILVLMVFEFPL